MCPPSHTGCLFHRTLNESATLKCLENTPVLPRGSDVGSRADGPRHWIPCPPRLSITTFAADDTVGASNTARLSYTFIPSVSGYICSTTSDPRWLQPGPSRHHRALAKSTWDLRYGMYGISKPARVTVHHAAQATEVTRASPSNPHSVSPPYSTKPNSTLRIQYTDTGAMESSCDRNGHRNQCFGQNSSLELTTR